MHNDKELDKKYKYHVCLSAEDYSDGYVELTKREAEIVAYVTDTKNWKDTNLNPYSGDFTIDLDNPEEIKDVDFLLKRTTSGSNDGWMRGLSNYLKKEML